LQHLNFKIKKARKNILDKNPKVLIFEVSAKNGKGFDKLVDFIEKELTKKK